MEELIAYWITITHSRDLIEKWHELPVALRWAGTGFIFAFVEINLHHWHFISIWFAVAAFSAALVAWLVPSALILQGFVFAAVAGIGFYYRPVVLNKYIGTGDHFTPPPDRLLGGEARCGPAG